MVYANGPNPFNFHTSKGKIDVLVDKKNKKVIITHPGEYENFYFIHGVILYFVWGIMTFLLFVTGRYF